MDSHVTNVNSAIAGRQSSGRSLLWHIADGINHLIQKIVLLFFYYVPISVAMLNPLLRRSDVRQVLAGSSRFEGGRYAIYVLWQPTGTIPWYIRNLLEELKEQHVNTIAVVNHDLSREQHNVLQELCAKTLVRGNKGLDFGAYKDAVLALTREHNDVSRLLLFNDSVYVFRRGLKDLISRLLSDDCPVVAPYECWERRYHFQSFCIAISASVLYDPRVQRFWQKYRPIALRRWRIDRGEVEFSETLRKVAPRYSVVFGLNELLDKLLADGDAASLLAYREYVPRPLRHLFPQDGFLPLWQQATPSERIFVLKRVKEILSDILMLRAQAHTGAFLFLKFLESPFLKRDLVYRELYTVYEVERILKDLGHGEYASYIGDEVRRRGTAAHLKGLMRRRHQLSLT